jgi:hypothetical protein
VVIWPPLSRRLAVLWRRVGRRGSALLFFATLDFIYGWSLFDPDSSALAHPGYRWLASVLPLAAWGAVWLFVGALCLIGAFVHEDSIAWVAAMSIKVMWGVLWFLGWSLAGVDRGWVSAAVWLPMAALVALLAGWPEPGNGRRPLWTRTSRQP